MVDQLPPVLSSPASVSLVPSSARKGQISRIRRPVQSLACGTRAEASWTTKSVAAPPAFRTASSNSQGSRCRRRTVFSQSRSGSAATALRISSGATRCTSLAIACCRNSSKTSSLFQISPTTPITAPWSEIGIVAVAWNAAEPVRATCGNSAIREARSPQNRGTLSTTDRTNGMSVLGGMLRQELTRSPGTPT